MSARRSAEYSYSLVRELLMLPRESEWVEFKLNNAEPEMIGEYVSALSNAAALVGRATAFIVWGIDDTTHEVIGTTFTPGTTKIGGEELENWLLRLLSPKISFRFHELVYDGKPVVLLEIGAAFRHPVQFKSQEFIRVGSHKVKLKDHPEKERELWRIFDRYPFERGIAAEHKSDEEVLQLLDYASYFELLNLPVPDGRRAIVEAMSRDDLLQVCDAGGWDISNLGAILLAKNLEDFPGLRRKALRIIHYRGNNRLETLREYTEPKGYASGFAGFMKQIMTLVPTAEIIGQAFRRSEPMYPVLAIRELVANALIHQDFFITGAGPTVELFASRIEITNPGAPLVSTERFLDSPPKSRNEGLASLMRRFAICEERGSGIDKVVDQIEQHQLPAPLFESPEGFTRTVVFAHRLLSDMDKRDRVRACYLHACLKYVQHDYLTNTSLRERFGIEEKNSATISRIIKETVGAGLITAYDELASRKYMKYIPWWAGK